MITKLLFFWGGGRRGRLPRCNSGPSFQRDFQTKYDLPPSPGWSSHLSAVFISNWFWRYIHPQFQPCYISRRQNICRHGKNEKALSGATSWREISWHCLLHLDSRWREISWHCLLHLDSPVCHSAWRRCRASPGSCRARPASAPSALKKATLLVAI